MMRTPQFIRFLGSLVLFFGSVAMAHADLPDPLTVDLPAPLHFLTPAGEDVVLPAGTYQVEAAESWLKLIPDGQRRTEAMLVDATSGTHEEPLAEITVRFESDPENPDVFHLAILKSDGTGLEAVGTQSGIRPRGGGLAFLSKFRKLQTVASATRADLRRPKIPLPVPGSQPLAPVPPVLKPIKSIKYLGNFPSDRNNGWSDGLQGVANDRQHWFFTQKGKLWKFPISHDLNNKVTRADHSKGILSVDIPKILEAAGYNHFGDLDYFDGYLFIPLEGGGATVVPRIAVFLADNLSYIGSFLLPKQTKAGWCAIHPITKQLYTSNISISPTDPLFVYDFDWGQLKTATDYPFAGARDHRSCTPDPKQVAFFADPNYQGACSLLGMGNYSNSSQIGVTNDSISSINVGSQAEVMVCHDNNMGGYCETITKSITWLRRVSRMVGEKALDDQISAAIISPIFSWNTSPKREFIFDGQGQNKLTIKGYLQGGDFSAYGQELYIVNGKGKDFNPQDGGIWVFSGNDLRLRERSSQDGKFKFEFHPGTSSIGFRNKQFQEPEGITIWNVPSGRAPGVSLSQVHVILLDNDWPDKDQLYFKHYEVVR